MHSTVLHTLLGLALIFLMPSIASARPGGVCNADNALEVTGEDIAAHAAKLEGSCVSLRAMMAGDYAHRALYGGPAAAYLAIRTGEYDRYRVGVLGIDNEEPEEPTWVRVIGWMTTCGEIGRRVRATAGDDIILLGGYCHYTNGPTISATEYHLDKSRKVTRLVGERHRSIYGNLKPHVPAGDLAEWLASSLPALREGVLARDRRALAQPFGVHPDVDILFQWEGVDWVLSEGSPFLGMTADQLSAVRLFARTIPRKYRYRSDEERPDIFACICRIDGCDDAWPISSLDVGYDPGRPYVCLEVGGYKSSYEFVVPSGRGMTFDEPLAPRMVAQKSSSGL